MNRAKFNTVKYNSLLVVSPSPVTYTSDYDIGSTRKAFWLNKAVKG